MDNGHLDLELRIKRPWWRRPKRLPCKITSLDPSGDVLYVTVETRLNLADIESNIRASLPIYGVRVTKYGDA